MGPSRYLFYTAFKMDVTITALASKYKKLKDTIPLETQVKNEKNLEAQIKVRDNNTTKENKEHDVDDKEEETVLTLDDLGKSNYVLTLTQVITQRGVKKEQDESMFEPISQVRLYCTQSSYYHRADVSPHTIK